MIQVPHPVIITFAWIGVITVALALVSTMYVLIYRNAKRSDTQDFNERNEEAAYFDQYPYAERPFVAYETTKN